MHQGSLVSAMYTKEFSDPIIFDDSFHDVPSGYFDAAILGIFKGGCPFKNVNSEV